MYPYSLSVELHRKIHTETGSARSSDCRTLNTGPTFSCFLLRLSSSLSLLQITLKNAFWFLRSFRGVGTSNAWSTIASNICHTTYDNEVKYRYTQQSTLKVYFIFFSITNIQMKILWTVSLSINNLKTFQINTSK